MPSFSNLKQIAARWYPLLIVLVLAALPRVYYLFSRGDFWFDEVYSARYSSLPWSDFFKYIFIETNPPLYVFFMRGWIYLFGDAEWTLRLPSFIFSLASICLVYLLAQKYFSRLGAVAAAIMISFSGLHLYESSENRVYSLLVVLAILSFYFFNRLLSEPVPGRRAWFIYGLINFLLISAHLTALLIPLIQWAVAYAGKANRNFKIKLFIYQLGGGLVWCGWFIPALLSKFSGAAINGWYFSNIAFSSNLLDAIVGLFYNANVHNLGNHDEQALFTLVSIFFLALIFLSVRNLLAEKEGPQKNLLLYLLLWALLPPVLGSLLGNPIPKFFITSIPAFALLLAAIASSNKLMGIAAAIIIAPLLLPSTLSLISRQVVNWQSLLKPIPLYEQKAKILIMPFHEAIVLERYYRGSIPIVGVYNREDNLSLEERAARFNWQKIITTKKDFGQWIGATLDGATSAYYIQYTPYSTLPIEWFKENGWRLNLRQRDPADFDLYLFHFTAPIEAKKR